MKPACGRRAPSVPFGLSGRVVDDQGSVQHPQFLELCHALGMSAGRPTDYQQLWRSDAVDEFAERVCDVWIAEYTASTGCPAPDIVVVDPGNGFNYVFDLAGSLTDAPCAWEPRV